MLHTNYQKLQGECVTKYSCMHLLLPLQSACRTGNFMEMAVIEVLSDKLVALDRGDIDIAWLVCGIWRRWPCDYDPSSSGVLWHTWASTGLVYVASQRLLGVRSFGEDSLMTNSAAIRCTTGLCSFCFTQQASSTSSKSTSATSSLVCWWHTGVWFLSTRSDCWSMSTDDSLYGGCS